MVVGYFVAAVGVVIVLANDPNWARWHVSYLGEGDGLSAHIFNALMMIGGVLMAGFSMLLYRQLKQLSSRCASRFILVNFLTISLCIYLIGLFPRSVGVLPHDIFGHAIYFLFLLLCLSAPWTAAGHEALVLRGVVPVPCSHARTVCAVLDGRKREFICG